MEKNVQDILANLPSKEILAQCPPEVVNAIEVLKDCVLSHELEKRMLVVALREEQDRKIAEQAAYYEKQLNELREIVYALQRKLNTNEKPA